MPVRWQAQYHAKWQGAQKSFSTLLDSNQGPCWVNMKFLWIVIQLVDFPNKIVELRRTVNLNLGCLFVSVEKATRMVCFSRKCFRRGHWQWHWNTRYNCYDCLWWSQANLFWVFRSFSELYQKNVWVNQCSSILVSRSQQKNSFKVWPFVLPLAKHFQLGKSMGFSILKPWNNFCSSCIAQVG